MKATKYIVSGILAVLTVVACGQKKEDSTSNVNGVGTAALPNSGPANFPNIAFVRGSAYVTGTDANQFTNMAKALLSTTVNPQNVGMVSPQNGVIIQGDIYVDKMTGNVLQNSSMQLQISDSFVGQSDGQGGTYQPIRISLYSQQGRASNGQTTVVFGDQYGTVTVVGTYSGNTFNAEVRFLNNGSNFNGVSQGSLGRFQMATCSFFRCQ